MTVGDVRVSLGRPDVGVAEHLLDAAEVGAALQQMRRERVPQQVRMHPAGLEAGAVREPAEDEERAGARERPAARVEEQVGAMAPIEMRPAERHVAAQRLGGGPAERDEALLASLAGTRTMRPSRSTQP